MKRYIIIGVIAVAVAGGAIVAIRGSAVPVQVTSPATMTVREYVAEDAKTRLAKEYIVDMPVSGTVRRIELEEGDYVEQGELVAEVDPYDIEQRVRQVEAQIAQRRAQIMGVDIGKPKEEDIESATLRVKEMENGLEISQKALAVSQFNFDEAERSYERAKGLLEAGAASESYLDEAERSFKALQAERNQREIAVEQAQKALGQARLAEQRLIGSIDDNEYQRDVLQAEIEALEADCSILREDLKKTQIVAPVSGPVLDKYVEDSRVLVEGSELLRLGDMDSIEIECDVLSEEVTAVSRGDKVIIRGKALRGQSIEGAVKLIYPSGFEKISSLGVEQQRVKTLIEFDNTQAQLRPGTSVDVEIITAEAPNALAVPDRAVFRQGDTWAVFTVVDGHAQLTAVDVGLRNEEWAEIRGGLTADALVISELTNDIRDGVRVSLSR